MLKKFILLLCLAAPIALVAQEKIAYVDANEIMGKMPELKEIEVKITAKGESLQKGITAMEEEYKLKLEEYGKKLEKFQAAAATTTGVASSEISEAEMLDSQKELSQIQERLETRAQTSNTEFDQFRQSLIVPMQEKLAKAIKEVGEENNFAYILDRNALHHVGASAVDAGKLVKAKLGIID